MLSPSPTPGDLSVSVRPPCTNGSNTRPRISDGIPGPQSATTSRNASGPAVNRTVTAPLPGAYFAELSSRLINACLIVEHAHLDGVFGGLGEWDERSRGEGACSEEISDGF
jgi:hypothetical protein